MARRHLAVKPQASPRPQQEPSSTHCSAQQPGQSGSEPEQRGHLQLPVPQHNSLPNSHMAATHNHRAKINSSAKKILQTLLQTQILRSFLSLEIGPSPGKTPQEEQTWSSVSIWLRQDFSSATVARICTGLWKTASVHVPSHHVLRAFA